MVGSGLTEARASCSDFRFANGLGLRGCEVGGVRVWCQTANSARLVQTVITVTQAETRLAHRE